MTLTTWAPRWIAAVTGLIPCVLFAGIGDGIGGTAHDFSGSGDSSTSSCVFCHTPYESKTQTLAWNHSLSKNTFSWNQTTTAGGTPYPTIQGDTYTGPTAKCLSCHDGTVAIGDIASWNGEPVMSTLANARISGAAQTASSTGRMDGNHPVAMPYPWNNAPSTYNGVTTGTGVALGEWQPDPEALGVRLYNDDGSGRIDRGPVTGRAGIECTSCHDPHNGSSVESAAFLRGTAANICTKCHRK